MDQGPVTMPSELAGNALRAGAPRPMQEMQEMSSCSTKEIGGDRIMGYIHYRKGVSDLRHLRHASVAADGPGGLTALPSATGARSLHVIARARAPP